MKTMKLLLSLFAAMTLSVAAQTVEINPPTNEEMDYKFIALNMWAQHLNMGLREYNNLCADNPATEGCANVRGVMSEQFKYYIQCANRYSDTSGDNDCRAKLRPQIVAQQVLEFQWNLDCVTPTGVISPQCAEQKKGILKQEAILKAKIDKCSDDIEKGEKKL